MEKEIQPIISKRKVFKIGESIAITLPKEWADQQHCKDGDEITVIGNSDLRVLSKYSKESLQRIYDKISEEVAKKV